MPEKAPRESYSRAEIRRHFKLAERQLQSWERQGLIAAAGAYSFSDLIAIKALLKLRENGASVRRIGRVVRSLREMLGEVKQPLAELRIVSDGKEVYAYQAGQKFEPVTGQVLFDFDAAELGALKAFPTKKRAPDLRHEAEVWFQRGLEVEETGGPIDRAVEAYQKALDLNPEAAGALVNLGTICYRQRRFAEAEKYYIQALNADRSYALAEFNLGNLYDEQNRIDEAIAHYLKALELNPNYADAHFNMALIRERAGEPLQSVRHWKAYLKLDRSGKWADVARRQLERLQQATVIQTSR